MSTFRKEVKELIETVKAAYDLKSLVISLRGDSLLKISQNTYKDRHNNHPIIIKINNMQNSFVLNNFPANCGIDVITYINFHDNPTFFNIIIDIAIGLARINNISLLIYTNLTDSEEAEYIKKTGFKAVKRFLNIKTDNKITVFAKSINYLNDTKNRIT